MLIDKSGVLHEACLYLRSEIEVFRFAQGDEVRILKSPRYENKWEGTIGIIATRDCDEDGKNWYVLRINHTKSHTTHIWFYEENLEVRRQNTRFKQGDEVEIRESAKYNNRWAGYTGVIAGNPYTRPNGEVSYPVRIDGIVNKDSETGRFWYGEKDLEMAALITEYRNPSPYTDYSDILGKTPVELGVSKEMLLLCEANEKKKEEKEMADKEYNGMVMFGTVSQALDWAKKELGVTSKGLAPDAITNVIFNPPATIVFWKDGSKTIVKCGAEDIYEPEVGLAMAISKKMFGNDGTFHKVFKKWLPEPEATDVEMLMSFKWLLSKLPDPKETAHTDGQKFYSMSDILREGMMSLYFKEHGEELCLDDKEKE